MAAGQISTNDTVYGYGVFGGAENTFDIRGSLTLDEHREAAAAVGLLAALKPSFHHKLVERNFHDLGSIHQFAITALSLGRGFGKPDFMGIYDSLMTSMLNWLAAWQLCLDHDQTRITKTFGAGSGELERFRAATASAFDQRAGYRVASKMRNFVIHCGLPRATVSALIDESKPAGATTTIVFHRDDLLERSTKWSKARPDLEAMDDSFDPMPMFADAMSGIRDVQRVAMDIRLDKR